MLAQVRSLLCETYGRRDLPSDVRMNLWNTVKGIGLHFDRAGYTPDRDNLVVDTQCRRDCPAPDVPEPPMLPLAAALLALCVFMRRRPAARIRARATRM